MERQEVVDNLGAVHKLFKGDLEFGQGVTWFGLGTGGAASGQLVEELAAGVT